MKGKFVITREGFGVSRSMQEITKEDIRDYLNGEGYAQASCFSDSVQDEFGLEVTDELVDKVIDKLSDMHWSGENVYGYDEDGDSDCELFENIRDAINEILKERG